MNRRDPESEPARPPKAPYRAPRIREYGRVRDLTRNTFNVGSGDTPAIFDNAS